MNGIYVHVILLLLLNRLWCEDFNLPLDSEIFRQNTRLTNHSLENKTNIGIGMCIRDCRATSGCQSVNYNTIYLLCELNSPHANVNSTDHFENQTDTFFVDVKSTEFLSKVPDVDSCYGTDDSTACPNGHTLIPLQSGQQKCIQRKRIVCSEGFFVNNSRCHPCPIGRFQPRKGMGWCDLCPVGTYQDKTGQVSCVLCNEGTYQNETGGSECHQCPQDGYEDHCLERDQRVASEIYPWSHISCDADTIGYFYSKYSYSTYRSSENKTECIWIPAIQDTHFTYFSSLYSTVQRTRVYTFSTTINRVRNACVHKCESFSGTCDAVMYEYRSSTYSSNDCVLLISVNETVSDFNAKI